MVVIKSAAHELAAIPYATGGIIDAVSEGISGHLAAPEESMTLAAHISVSLKDHLPELRMLTIAEQSTWQCYGAQMDVLLRLASPLESTRDN